MKERPTRQETMMAHAVVASARGTCSRLSVGVVVARDARILVTGYNGAPAGMVHCDHKCKCREIAILNQVPHPALVHFPECPASDSHGCDVAVHAEANAIAYAAKEGVTLDGTDMFSTHQPCLRCAQLIINAGIMSVTYKHPYRLGDGLSLLHDAGVQVWQAWS